VPQLVRTDEQGQWCCALPPLARGCCAGFTLFIFNKCTRIVEQGSADIGFGIPCMSATVREVARQRGAARCIGLVHCAVAHLCNWPARANQFYSEQYAAMAVPLMPTSCACSSPCDCDKCEWRVHRPVIVPLCDSCLLQPAACLWFSTASQHQNRRRARDCRPITARHAHHMLTCELHPRKGLQVQQPHSVCGGSDYGVRIFPALDHQAAVPEGHHVAGAALHLRHRPQNCSG
jgi:hypothetical protein